MPLTSTPLWSITGPAPPAAAYSRAWRLGEVVADGVEDGLLGDERPLADLEAVVYPRHGGPQARRSRSRSSWAAAARGRCGHRSEPGPARPPGLAKSPRSQLQRVLGEEAVAAVEVAQTSAEAREARLRTGSERGRAGRRTRMSRRESVSGSADEAQLGGHAPEGRPAVPLEGTQVGDDQPRACSQLGASAAASALTSARYSSCRGWGGDRGTPPPRRPARPRGRRPALRHQLGRRPSRDAVGSS